MKKVIGGVVRHVLTFGGGYAVAKGWLDEASLELIIGAVMAVIGMIWSVKDNSDEAELEARRK